MKELRFWFIGILGWFFLLYNMERLSEPINVASFIYILTMVFAILIILFPWFQRIPLLWLLMIPLPLYFALKIWLGYPIGGRNLPITITELCALALTTILAQQVGQRLEEFLEAVTDLMVNHLKNRACPFEEGQGEMYREVRWARKQQRPLALLTISVAAETPDLSINRFIEEVQRETIKKYLIARLANFLSEEMRERDLIAQRGDYFIALLPEVGCDHIAEFAKKLENAAKEKLGLTLKVGTSTFPEEVTFEKLVDRAEVNMWSSALVENGQMVGMSASAETVLYQRDTLELGG